MDWLIFTIVALLAVAGALGVVLSRNPVHSALSLVMTLFSMAIFFVMQGAHFVAAVQVIVYAGAIVVLFLFVIMLLGVDREEMLEEPLRGQRPAAFVVGAALIAELLILARVFAATGAPAQRGEAIGGTTGNVEKIARSLFTDFLWPFEVTSVLLVIAVVGAVVLAKRPGREADQDAAI
jgi:NADH-quinone oxidoreductase subunit J